MSELLKFFQPRSAGLEFIVGGIPSVTPEMVAAACHGLTRQVYLYALVKFALDGRSANELYRVNRDAVAHMARVKRWAEQEGFSLECIVRAGDIALRESLVCRHCGHCGGAGVHNNQRQCKACGGNGRAKPVPNDALARYAGVTSKQWGMLYSDKFEALKVEYAGFDDLIARKIRKSIFGESDG